ncbi:hypothetical protein T05_14504 [Trichinella murrelli]|uniref:Uncharacterized protein n=1 Tax=Trichinella murrelli TaxID=144512 RepID=A0A0V0SRW4_9BILA|nr:hypothetical protein T05_14504 [Trichinella murrelli]
MEHTMLDKAGVEQFVQRCYFAHLVTLHQLLIVRQVEILLYFHETIAAHTTDGTLCTHVWLRRPVVFCFWLTDVT